MDEHTLNDLLECSVCLERLDTSSKVLPCQHTFCRKCLEVIYASRQELRCPECRILVDTKIDELPPNVLLMRILEGMKNAASKQHSIINEITRETNEKKETIRLLPTTNTTGGITATAANTMAAAALNSNIANEERIRQQIQQQQLKQRQQQILQFQQQIQQQHHMHPTQNQPTLQQQTSQQQQLQQQQQQSLQTQQRRCIVPHAYALYDFESNETNDLKFKKGDLIFLKRKIDSNWYVGQLKGTEGNFPINYVQIVVPLPTSQCVALYDFKMGPNEEEGCLTFKKGTVIQVLRRVDHNWAEGRIGSSIGIFPIAFVELNQLAKQLLEGFVLSTTATQQPSTHHGQQAANNDVRNLPPLPPVIDPTTNINNGDSTTSSSAVSSTTNTASSSSNSSTNTSPTTASVNPTTSSNSASFHSMPNSPQSSKPSTPQHSVTTIANPSNSVRMRNNDLKHKRHSLNALLNNGSTALSIMQTNRHSAEILSVPNDFDSEPTSSSSMSTAAAGQTIAAREQQVHTSNIPSASRHNVLKTCVQQSIPPSLPWGYLALYPYKPRKVDELELKKGCVYMVTERCLDGWFKGKNWKDVSGVFPGNYVTPLRTRDQQQLMHSWKLVPPSASMQSNYQSATSLSQAPPSISTAGNPTGPQQQLSPSYPSSMRNDLENINARLTLANLTPHQAMPPDLPPRYLTISPTPPPSVTNSNNMNMTTKENRDKEAQKEKPTATGCISTSSSSSSSTSSASAGLKKFLTHIKTRSKSPSAAVAAAAASVATIQANVITQSHNNVPQQLQQHTVKPTAQSIQTQMTSSLTPVHVRSGSCPSQLLQNLPNDVYHGNQIENKNPNSTTTTTTSQQSSPQNNYGSHRVKGPKERASLDNTRPTIDSTLRSIYANHLQQQSALMANKCGQQYQQQQQQHQLPLTTNSNSSLNNTAIAIHHRKSHSLDASNILQSSPITPNTSSFSNSGAGAGGSVGGSVTSIKTPAPQCNINAAAIHASATTKSTQNMSESRFRCVVPYPPNSDVELELQVGDIIFVYRKQKNGWYKGTNSRTYKTGLFPASFVEPDI
ncbi:E3 ubiquitin-protein ligase SH3RF1 isoform X2 [Calliphora vicina]|uniref:E3 ubiquitin-protein ligase SH3RF1 isoform X2 n=1 Tax=Calliphora vicina TaxID=7373 RepID=UPI00325B1FC1